MRFTYILGFIVFLVLANYTHCKNHGNLSGVLLSAEKDIPILGKVLRSVLENLELSLLYVVVPGRKYELLRKQYSDGAYHRVRMVNEDWLRIPISKKEVKPIMVESARRAGIYRNLSKKISVPDGKRTKLIWEPPSELETFIDEKAQWYWQQLIKLLIGKALSIEGDYVVLDGDVVWYRKVQLLQSCPPEATEHEVPDFYSASMKVPASSALEVPPARLCKYLYATSAQYHKPYLHALTHLLGINLLQSGSALATYAGFGRQDAAPTEDGRLHAQHTSGIAHHMVFVRPVLDSMLNHIEAIGSTRYCGEGRARIRTSRSGDCLEQAKNGFHHRYLSSQNVSYSYSETADNVVLTFDSRYTEDSITDPSNGLFDGMGRRTVVEEILEYAASAMVCGPTTLCDKLQAVSEYELYFQYARIFFPKTISMRSLLWANGPQPGLLYWPTLLSTVPLLSRIKQWWSGGNDAKAPILLKGQLHGKKLKDYYDVREEENWLDGGDGAKEEETGTSARSGSHQPDAVFSPKQRHFFDMQTMADKAQGYHFVAYHSHAKQRRFELRLEDALDLCTSGKLQPSEELYNDKTCSFIGLIDNTHTMHLNVDEKMLPMMFRGCACSDLMQIIFRT